MLNKGLRTWIKFGRKSVSRCCHSWPLKNDTFISLDIWKIKFWILDIIEYIWKSLSVNFHNFWLPFGLLNIETNCVIYWRKILTKLTCECLKIHNSKYMRNKILKLWGVILDICGLIWHNVHEFWSSFWLSSNLWNSAQILIDCELEIKFHCFPRNRSFNLLSNKFWNLRIN